MKLPLETAGAAVAVLGLLVWIALAVSDRSSPDEAVRAGPDAQEATEASSVPCRVPLAWRVAGVDAEFDASQQDVERTVRRAASLWEEAVEADLFVHRPDIGFPIRLVYGERQVRSRDRRQREEELRADRRRLDDRRRELEAEAERLEAERPDFQERLGDFRDRLERHNDSVRTWNERGGAPRPVAEDLQSARETLDREQAELRERQRELEGREGTMQEESERLDRRIEEHRDRVENAERNFPAERVESGRYRESVQLEEGRVESVEREIRVFRFDDERDLERILAHELGHALGLGHTSVTGALMSREYGREGDGDGRVRAADREILHERCPEL